jgi:hypothetical protein
LDASPDICRHVTLTLVPRTSTLTLARDEKFPISAEKNEGANCVNARAHEGVKL